MRYTAFPESHGWLGTDSKQAALPVIHCLPQEGPAWPLVEPWLCVRYCPRHFVQLPSF